MTFPIVALWSHPRSMSTAFERIMRARGDLECLHEPFMYDYYINRSKRQMPHFDAQDDHPRSYDQIRGMILAKAERGPVFFKDMAYYVVPHLLDDAEFAGRISHRFLVRDPRAAIVSYAKLDPQVTREEIGIEAQWQLAAGLMARSGKPPIVIESERLRTDPASQMRKYWGAVGLPEKPDALDWNEPVPKDWEQVSAWHREVMESKTIRPYTEDEVRESQEKFD